MIIEVGDETYHLPSPVLSLIELGKHSGRIREERQYRGAQLWLPINQPMYTADRAPALWLAKDKSSQLLYGMQVREKSGHTLSFQTLDHPPDLFQPHFPPHCPDTRKLRYTDRTQGA